MVLGMPDTTRKGIMKTEEALTGMITGCTPLFAHLWPVALGEPAGPDGFVYEYGDDQLSELVIELFNGETAGWSYELSRHAALCSPLWEKSRTVTAEQVENLDAAAWERVRIAVLEAHPSREIRCPNCDESVKANEDDFHTHYQENHCW
jgi:hypothetical protein